MEYTKTPGGYFQIRRSGGLGPHIKFGGKIWGKVRSSSPNERKNLGSSVTTRRKSWEKVPILGSHLKFRGQNLGYLSFIFLDAKFGAPTRISEAKFGAKPPPRPPNMEVPPWTNTGKSIPRLAFDQSNRKATGPALIPIKRHLITVVITGSVSYMRVDQKYSVIKKIKKIKKEISGRL